MSVTLGTDPELFVIAQSGRFAGQVLPSYFALGASGVTGVELPHGVLVGDGAAIEWTQTPTSSAATMVTQMRENLRQIQAFVSAAAVDIDGKAVTTTLACSPTVDVPWDYIGALPESFGKQYSLQILGCSPDADIYSGESIDRPDPKTFQMRTSGGHMHFGVGDRTADYNLMCAITGVLDAVLGTASVYLLAGDDAKRRAKLYGVAGTIRVKHEIGVLEYRVLPAKMLLSDPDLADLCFSVGQAAVEYTLSIYDRYGLEGVERALGGPDGVDVTRNAINAFDVERARAAVGNLYYEIPTLYRELREGLVRLLRTPVIDGGNNALSPAWSR